MTQAEALELLDGYDDNPDSFEFCDALCAVADALGDDSDDLDSDDLRARIHELSDDDGEASA